MAASDVIVTLTLDSELGKMIAEMAEIVKQQQEQIDFLRSEIGTLCASNSTTDLRIQILENLPGVADAVKAAKRALE